MSILLPRSSARRTRVGLSLLGVLCLSAGTTTVLAAMTPRETAGVSVTTEMQLTESGDANQNGIIDSGDQLTLHFTLANTGGTEYAFATLQTGLDRGVLRRIWNVRGVTGFTLDDNTVTFPNLRIGAHQKIDIFADATVDIFLEGEKTIALAPQLIDSNGAPIAAPQQTTAMRAMITAVQRQVAAWTGPLPQGFVTSSANSSVSTSSVMSSAAFSADASSSVQTSAASTSSAGASMSSMAASVASESAAATSSSMASSMPAESASSAPAAASSASMSMETTPTPEPTQPLSDGAVMPQ